MLQSPGLQRVGRTQGLTSSHCPNPATPTPPTPPPSCWEFKSSEEGLCHTGIHLPSPEFHPPTENQREGSPS